MASKRGAQRSAWLASTLARKRKAPPSVSSYAPYKSSGVPSTVADIAI